MERTIQTLTLMNFHEFHEPMEIKSIFQQPSTSEPPLLYYHRELKRWMLKQKLLKVTPQNLVQLSSFMIDS